ncbi:MAG TPA: PCRF domain-containing protein, partial [Candidatus Elarobacter sp.]|nr:PCRF domain-containing protein [Candidatus Elarobacter sp.]
MKPTLRTKLDSLVGRLEHLNGLLAAEGATRDLEQFRKLSREHSELTGIVALYERFRRAEGDAEAAREMAADAAMRSFADDELKAARGSMEKLEADLQKALLPRDPNDERNIFLEIRAGAGGDESALFAADLFRM